MASVVNLRGKIIAWIRIRTRVSSFMRWRYNQLSYPDESLGQARIILLDPHYQLVPSIPDGGEYLCWYYFNQGFSC